ncbi:MAG TPA: response regulator [Kiritimatiellia bacterium]|jgi:DNA-binding NtrC family response regulator|nr:response regulator [Kiritimatiellia bacterium]HOR97668.1 response regulator [Kiritimatiellia bacterium]HPC48725.1 response regulator [Kiritimatiellia bacterium]HPK37592.1 response regulator [Kiritimatiellia bacterium]HPW74831.1 response regulator [Kiritimatiellia bacterium]
MARILIVDDEPGLLMFFQRLLNTNGYDVVVAEDGVTALDVIRKTEIDLIISDLRMPRMDGMTLLREVKAIKPDIPVIILTAYASDETAIESKRIGVFEYRSKPFNAEKLLDTIENALGAAKNKEAGPLDSRGGDPVK